MIFPRMSARRWFLILTAAFLLWTLATGSIFGGNQDSATPLPVARRAEGYLRNVSSTLLLPVSRTLRRAQESWIHLITKSPDAGGQRVSYSDLEQENIRLQRELAIRLAENERLENLLIEYKLLHERFPTLSSEKMLPANITGEGGGVDGEFCTLDRGSIMGVQAKFPVLLQWAILGRVYQTGPYTCSVRLLTDRNSKVEARLVRTTPRGDIVIANPCLVYGGGNGTLRCDSVEVQRNSPRTQAVPPMPGDFLTLSDRDWPLALRGAIIGQVQEVLPSENNSLRYDLHIEPAVTVHTPGQAFIVLMNQ